MGSQGRPKGLYCKARAEIISPLSCSCRSTAQLLSQLISIAFSPPIQRPSESTFVTGLTMLVVLASPLRYSTNFSSSVSELVPSTRMDSPFQLSRGASVSCCFVRALMLRRMSRLRARTTCAARTLGHDCPDGVDRCGRSDRFSLTRLLRGPIYRS